MSSGCYEAHRAHMLKAYMVPGSQNYLLLWLRFSLESVCCIGQVFFILNLLLKVGALSLKVFKTLLRLKLFGFIATCNNFCFLSMHLLNDLVVVESVTSLPEGPRKFQQNARHTWLTDVLIKISNHIFICVCMCIVFSIYFSPITRLWGSKPDTSKATLQDVLLNATACFIL